MNGKKTYLVAAAVIVAAVLNALAGSLTWPDALELVVPAILGVTIRHGIATKAK